MRTRGITTKPILVHSFNAGTKRVSSTPAHKWVVDPNDQPFIGPLNQWEDEPKRSYIPLLTTKSPDMVVDTINNIDLHPYELTKYEVNDYVKTIPLHKNRRWKPGHMVRTGGAPTL